MKTGEAEAFKRLANLISAPGEYRDEKSLGLRLIVWMDLERRVPKFEIEVAGAQQGGSDDLDAALAGARGGG